MLPILEPSDFVLLDTAKVRTYKRGSIIGIYDENDDKLLYKRIIGLGGEVINIKKNQLLINNGKVEYEIYNKMKYSTNNSYECMAEDKSFIVHIDSLFTIDDNAFASHNYFEGKMISVKDIEGFACKIIWPPSRISLL